MRREEATLPLDQKKKTNRIEIQRARGREMEEERGRASGIPRQPEKLPRIVRPGEGTRSSGEWRFYYRIGVVKRDRDKETGRPGTEERVHIRLARLDIGYNRGECAPSVFVARTAGEKRQFRCHIGAAVIG